MASTVLETLHLPFPREHVLTLPPIIAELRERAPIVPVITATGDPAWFVIAFDEAKAAFSDSRFGYYTHEDPKNASRMSEAAMHSHPMGNIDFEDMMARMRKLLAPGFTPRRLIQLEGWVQELVDGCLDLCGELFVGVFTFLCQNCALTVVKAHLVVLLLRFVEIVKFCLVD